ncbi:hypothetical protein [Paraburkholderia agricolaris]|jgi:hypothetical protein|uniref:hypothetical protein n=1 Tax=Paraburkholderia agricolaris TaxID=2152888 RepID=UPI001C2B8DD0|nr:hypothetical protein [Paraburkholderia agricolaris]
MAGQFFDSEVSAQNGQGSTTLIVIGATDQSHQLIAVSEYPKTGIQCLVELRIVDSNHSPAHVGELLPLAVGLDTANDFRRTVTNIGFVHNASSLLS